MGSTVEESIECVVDPGANRRGEIRTEMRVVAMATITRVFPKRSGLLGRQR